jgi:hypothetical protein
VLSTDQITPALAEEFGAGVRWLQTHGQPDLTPGHALAEAIEDWIALVRIEHLGGDDIPGLDGNPSPRFRSG